MVEFATVSSLGIRGMITLRGDLTALAKVTDLTDVDSPAVGCIAIAGDRALGWMSPDELLLLLPHTEVGTALARIAQGLQGVHHLATDVSDARAIFELRGPGAREVLAKLAPVDLHPDHFGPGQLRRSRLGQVAAAFWMCEDDAFTIICFRSVAAYTLALLKQSAADGPVGHFN